MILLLRRRGVYEPGEALNVCGASYPITFPGGVEAPFVEIDDPTHIAKALSDGSTWIQKLSAAERPQRRGVPPVEAAPAPALETVQETPPVTPPAPEGEAPKDEPPAEPEAPQEAVDEPTEHGGHKSKRKR